MKRTIFAPGMSEVVTSAIADLEMHWEQAKDRDDIWISEFSAGGQDGFCVIQMDDADAMIRVYATIPANDDRIRPNVLELFVRLNVGMLFTHYEYDFNYPGYRCAGSVKYRDGWLSEAMVRRLISRCLDGIGRIMEILDAFMAGRLAMAEAVATVRNRTDGNSAAIRENAESPIASPEHSDSIDNQIQSDLTPEQYAHWESRVGQVPMRFVRWLTGSIKEALPGVAFKSGTSYISVGLPTRPRGTDFIFFPQKKAIVFAIRVADTDQLRQELNTIGAAWMPFDDKAGRCRFSLVPTSTESAKLLLIQLLRKSLPELATAAMPASCATQTALPRTNDDVTNHNTGEDMRLTDTLREWLKEHEWKEEPEIDEEQKSSSTAFDLEIDDFNLRGFFEVNEAGEIFKLFMYFFDTKCPEKRLGEVQEYVTALSNKLSIGSLQLLPKDRVIRFYAGIDVEGASFEPAHISNLLSAAIRTLKDALPKFMAISFGGKSAAEVMAEES